MEVTEFFVGRPMGSRWWWNAPAARPPRPFVFPHFITSSLLARSPSLEGKKKIKIKSREKEKRKTGRRSPSAARADANPEKKKNAENGGKRKEDDEGGGKEKKIWLPLKRNQSTFFSLCKSISLGGASSCSIRRLQIEFEQIIWKKNWLKNENKKNKMEKSNKGGGGGDLRNDEQLEEEEA